MNKQKLANFDIRKAIKEEGLRHFEVFDELKISQASWTNLLCRPLNEENRQMILDAVKRLSKGR